MKSLAVEFTYGGPNRPSAIVEGFPHRVSVFCYRRFVEELRGLFWGMTAIHNMTEMFKDCTGLSGKIPAGLFETMSAEELNAAFSSFRAIDAAD